MPSGIPSLESIQRLRDKLARMDLQYWLHHDLFTWQWWLLLALLVLPWLLWWKLIDKRELRYLLMYGLIIMIFVFLLDELGSSLTLWSYPYMLYRLIPTMHPIDITVLPVLYMLVLYYFRRWSTFLPATVVMSAAFSFAAEPLFVLMDIYRLEEWRHVYSLPIYAAIAVVARAILHFVWQAGAPAPPN